MIGYQLDGPNGLRIILDPNVLDHFDKHRQHSCLRREAGGQLFAKIEGDVWKIDLATGPRPTDWRTRFGYHPDRKAERLEIDEIFKLGLHFVGDWHTHPQKKPKGSSTDIGSMDDEVLRSTHSLPGFLMIIIGTRPFPEGLWVSFHTGSARHLILDPQPACEERTVSKE